MDEEFKIERKQTEEKYEGKGRGKKLETENKELKDENRKHNNELKELKKVIIWLNMKIYGNTIKIFGRLYCFDQIPKKTPYNRGIM
jgi:hypothetical protein